MGNPSYFGMKDQVKPSDLDRLDASGQFVAERKVDGHWVEVVTDAHGVITKLTSRAGKEITGSKVQGIVGHAVGLPSSVLIGELEAGTEAANRTIARVGHVRLHVFDATVLLGQKMGHLPLEKRRELLEMAIPGDAWVSLVKRVSTGFKKLYDEVIAAGGEGIVLKKRGSTYGQGKGTSWLKCKPLNTVDYVVMSVGKSAGGSDNLQVGLYDERGTLKRVAAIKDPPRGVNLRSLVGRVIECRGAEIHESGALRHAAFVRVRNDKDPRECVL